MKDIVCYHCQHRWSFDPPLSRRSSCPSCLKDAKVCLNCSHYDPNVHNECRESSAEWVKNKEDGNYCEYFRPKVDDHKPEAKAKQRDALESLFKKNSSPPQDSKKTKSSMEEELQKFIKEKKR